MVVDFDIDGDGKITEQEIAMKERMLEVELREEKAESQKFMAWVAMGMMIIFTIFLFTLTSHCFKCIANRFLPALTNYCTEAFIFSQTRVLLTE